AALSTPVIACMCASTVAASSSYGSTAAGPVALWQFAQPRPPFAAVCRRGQTSVAKWGSVTPPPVDITVPPEIASVAPSAAVVTEVLFCALPAPLGYVTCSVYV